MKLEVREAKASGEAKGTILFVHGALHGAWCWDRFMEYFPAAGYDCYAMSFRGHGESEGADALDSFGLDDYAADLKQVVGQMPEPPIVVAHSLGGMVLQRYLGENPGSVRQAVFLASMPVGGTTFGDQLKMLLAHFGPTRTMLDINAGKQVPPAKLKDAVIFGGRISEADLAPYAPLIKAESKQVTKDQAKPSTDKFDVGVPVSIIGSRGDWMFADQTENACAYGVEAVMLDDLCHDMMLDKDWKRAADAVLEAIA